MRLTFGIFVLSILGLSFGLGGLIAYQRTIDGLSASPPLVCFAQEFSKQAEANFVLDLSAIAQTDHWDELIDVRRLSAIPSLK